MRRFISVIGFLMVCALTTAGLAQTNVEEFAKRLADLRTEVDGLSMRLEETKEGQRAEKRSLATQKADLEFQIQREERRIKELEAQTQKAREELKKVAGDSENLVPEIKDSLGILRARIETSLPFKRAERLGNLRAIEEKLEKGVLTPQKAAVQLWAAAEDELRLGRENGLYRQVIELESDEMLVDVARLGMVTMYFQADDGRTGWVEKHDSEWKWVVTKDAKESQEIALLFDAMSKQIRTGYFQLPGPMGALK